MGWAGMGVKNLAREDLYFPGQPGQGYSQVSRGPGLPGQDPFPVQPDLTEFPQARIRQSDLDSG